MLYSQKILVVEDVGLIALDIKTMLISAGFTNIKIAYNGNEAIKISGSYSPDLILMDIILGEGITGIEAARRIKEDQSVQLIYITGSSDAETQREVKETYPVSIIIKPVYFNELVIAVKRALGIDFNPDFSLQNI